MRYLGLCSVIPPGSLASSLFLAALFLTPSSAPAQSGSYRTGWNMISQPNLVADDTVAHVYPSASSSAFAYDQGSGYVAHVEFTKINGYWLKFPEPTDLYVSGTMVDSTNVPVVSGWNLIPSVSVPVGVSTLNSDPPGIITSNFFGYIDMYVHADTINPGSAYWVKVSSDGELVLDATPGPSVNRIRIVPTDELPPAPPDASAVHPGDAPTGSAPGAFALHANYPNPFNPVTEIGYDLPTDSRVRIAVYDLLGREIAVLADGIQPAGSRTVLFDAGMLTSGVYFYRLEASPLQGGTPAFRDLRKMVVMK